MNSYPKAAEGLKIMFLGKIAELAASYMNIVGSDNVVVLANVLSLVGSALFLLGLYKAGEEAPRYRTVCVLQLLFLLLSLAGSSIVAYMESVVLAVGINILIVIFSLVCLAMICQTTSELLLHLGQSRLAAKGKRALILMSIGLVGMYLMAMALIVQESNLGMLMLLALPISICSLVGSFTYLKFLYCSSKALQPPKESEEEVS